MTEADWLSDNSHPGHIASMFSDVRSPHDRKQRLVVLGILRVMAAARPPDSKLEQLLAAHEDWVDHRDFSRFARDRGELDRYWWELDLSERAWRRVIITGLRGVGNGGDCRVTQLPIEPEEGWIAWAVARDVFGNPFRPAVFEPRWRSADVAGLARGVYADRAFERLPMLADALMDAGCDSEGILAHCRSAGPHVRGCWVVDLVLGFE